MTTPQHIDPAAVLAAWPDDDAVRESPELAVEQIHELAEELAQKLRANRMWQLLLTPDDPAHDDAVEALLRRTTKAEAEIARLRAGESDEPVPEGTQPTPGQLLRRLHDAPLDDRLLILARILDNATEAAACFERNHDGRIRSQQAELDATRLLAENMRRERDHAHRECAELAERLKIAGSDT
jgi:hypothetical protein